MGQWLSRKQDRWFQGSQVKGTVAVRKTGRMVSRESGEWGQWLSSEQDGWCQGSWVIGTVVVRAKELAGVAQWYERNSMGWTVVVKVTR